MKIKLAHPYSQHWDKGYLATNSENRKTVILYKSNPRKMSSTSYARYLMAVKLGRYLGEDEHVDHINEDKTDDRIENLQIISLRENNRKYVSRKVGKEMADVVCPNCKRVFSKERKRTHLARGGKYTFCSRKCSGLFYGQKKHSQVKIY